MEFSAAKAFENRLKSWVGSMIYSVQEVKRSNNSSNFQEQDGVISVTLRSRETGKWGRRVQTRIRHRTLRRHVSEGHRRLTRSFESSIGRSKMQ